MRLRSSSGRPAMAALLSAVLAGCYQAQKYPPEAGVDVERDAAGRKDAPAGGSGGNGGSSAAGGAGGVGPTACKSGDPCVIPGKPCLVGATACDGSGQATCTETTRPQANGSPCGGESVCLDGVCSGCKAGLECPIEGAPCRTGVIECASGKPECTEIGNAPNGATCGQGMVCKEGACTTCGAGDSCVPANLCHDGTLACTGGVAICNDSGTSRPPGGQCGANRVCSPTGECLACTAGMACDLPNEPCKIGKTDCSTGAPVCVPAGDAANGTACGNGQVCSVGTCVACNAGSPCFPTNKCHTGTLSCDSGIALCQDTGSNAANGTSCGTNQYCSNGSCVPCTPNASCSTGNPCKTGTTSCATGTSECRETGNAPNGRNCGSGQVCSNGRCMACQEEMACQPSACKVGSTSCSSGTSRCTETGNAPNDRACGNGMLCNNGSCVSCQSLGRRLCGSACVQGNCCDDGDCSNGFACVSNRCSTSQCRTGMRLCGTVCINSTLCCTGGQPGCPGATCSGNTLTTTSCGNGVCQESRRDCGTPSCSGDTRTVPTCQGNQCGTRQEGCNGYGCSGSACRTTCTGDTIRCGQQCVSGNCCNDGPCGGHRCVGNTCQTSCSSDSACVSGNRCIGGRCQMPKRNGERCASGSECQSTFCAGSSNGTVCCNERCNGANQTCNSGSCATTCGGENQACCRGAPFCSSGLSCDSHSAPNPGAAQNVCRRCGRAGQLCCGTNPDNSIGTCQQSMTYCGMGGANDVPGGSGCIPCGGSTGFECP